MKAATAIIWGCVFCLGIVLTVMPFYFCRGESLIGQLLASSIFALWIIMALLITCSLLRKKSQPPTH